MAKRALMIGAAILILWLLTHLILRRPARNPYIVAHRGAAGLAPENTLAAVRAGIESGAARIEVDVQRSSDGVLLLFHDAQIELPSGGRARIGELAYDDLRAIGVEGEPIPSFDEALALFAAEAGPEQTFVIEAKDPVRYPGIASELTHALDAHDLRGRVIVISFYDGWLPEFHQAAPDVAFGSVHVYALSVPRLPGLRTVGTQWIGALADPTLLPRIHARGADAVVWTTDSPALMRLLFWLGVDGVTTNRPDLWRE